jgi:hypothetical protein
MILQFGKLAPPSGLTHLTKGGGILPLKTKGYKETTNNLGIKLNVEKVLEVVL